MVDITLALKRRIMFWLRNKKKFQLHTLIWRPGVLEQELLCYTLSTGLIQKNVPACLTIIECSVKHLPIDKHKDLMMYNK